MWILTLAAVFGCEAALNENVAIEEPSESYTTHYQA